MATGNDTIAARQVDAPALAMPERARRVLWRCRRGMRELDLLLQRYMGERYGVAPPAERRAFERLLELPDPQIAACLLHGEPAPDAELGRLLARLRPGGA